MPDEYLVDRPNGRQAIRLEQPPIGSGGEGDIHRVVGEAGTVAKVYHTRMGATHASRAKLTRMLSQPPRHLTVSVKDVVRPVFSWPTHIIDDAHGNVAGFLMQEVPASESFALTRYLSHRLRTSLSDNDRSLTTRVRICCNLAAVVADLHRQGHFVIDLKPDNIRVYKDTGVVCLLDNDGFSVAGADGHARHPASAITEDYKAREIVSGQLAIEDILDDRTDRYALAVLLFQVLNNGQHPYQGKPLMRTDQWNISFCVANGLYPYGSKPHPEVAPSPASLHDCLLLGTLSMFERALAGPPALRPTAAQWAAHFEGLLSAKGRFVPCALVPRDVAHIHFAGMPCPTCRMESISDGLARTEPTSVSSVVPASRPGALAASGTAPVHGATPPPVRGTAVAPVAIAALAMRAARFALSLLVAAVMYVLIKTFLVHAVRAIVPPS